MNKLILLTGGALAGVSITLNDYVALAFIVAGTLFITSKHIKEVSE